MLISFTHALPSSFSEVKLYFGIWAVAVNYKLLKKTGKGFVILNLKQVRGDSVLTVFMCFPFAPFSAKDWDHCCTVIIANAGLGWLLYFVINIIYCHVVFDNEGLRTPPPTPDAREGMIQSGSFL